MTIVGKLGHCCQIKVKVKSKELGTGTVKTVNHHQPTLELNMNNRNNLIKCCFLFDKLMQVTL